MNGFDDAADEIEKSLDNGEITPNEYRRQMRALREALEEFAGEQVGDIRALYDAELTEVGDDISVALAIEMVDKDAAIKRLREALDKLKGHGLIEAIHLGWLDANPEKIGTTDPDGVAAAIQVRVLALVGDEKARAVLKEAAKQ